MVISGGGNFTFWDYAVDYGIFSEVTGELIGFRDDVPEEVKKSWEEYLKLMKQYEIEKYEAREFKV